MSKKGQSRILVFILSLLVWLGLTRGGGAPEIWVGLAAAVIVAGVAGGFLAGFPRGRGIARRVLFAVRYLARFLWEMIKANLHVAAIVLSPRRPIRPGIVKIRTDLTRDTALTVLANSITLTPGTFTIDIQPDRRELYIHCITVASTDVAENSRAIGGKFERILKEVFE
jgi:multicomponent Na+:H+ antiporter subunit E